MITRKEYLNQWEDPRAFPPRDRAFLSRIERQNHSAILAFGEGSATELSFQAALIHAAGYVGQAEGIRVRRISRHPEQIAIQMDQLTISSEFVSRATSAESGQIGDILINVPDVGQLRLTGCGMSELGTSVSDSQVSIVSNVVFLSVPRTPVMPQPVRRVQSDIRSATPSEYRRYMEDAYRAGQISMQTRITEQAADAYVDAQDAAAIAARLPSPNRAGLWVPGKRRILLPRRTAENS